eukprot:Polyplicarium_translucidae@DN68_c0_g1_i1.p1
MNAAPNNTTTPPPATPTPPPPKKNCRVVVRIRPLTTLEEIKGSEICVRPEGSNDLVLPATQKRFPFDAVLGPDADQQETFDTCCKPLIDSFLQGYNCCILSYGQTGSGKTWTMGTAKRADEPLDEQGIVPRFLEELFDKITAASGSHEITVGCTFLEIYNEEINDLLDPDTDALSARTSAGRAKVTRKLLKVVEDPQTRQISVMGAQSALIESREEALDCLHQGAVYRMTGATCTSANTFGS